jgi:hypothetical protein
LVARCLIDFFFVCVAYFLVSLVIDEVLNQDALCYTEVFVEKCVSKLLGKGGTLLFPCLA